MVLFRFWVVLDINIAAPLTVLQCFFEMQSEANNDMHQVIGQLAEFYSRSMSKKKLHIHIQSLTFSFLNQHQCKISFVIQLLYYDYYYYIIIITYNIII